MNTKTVTEMVSLMNLNFSLKLGTEDLMGYCKLYHRSLTKNNVSEKAFVNAVDTLIDKTKHGNFNKMPCVGDLLDIMGIAPKSPQEIAQSQAETVLVEINTFHTVPNYKIMFDDPVTNYVIQNTFGGMARMSFELNQYNENKTKPEWIKKRFVEAYIAANDSGRQQNTPVTSHSKKSFDDGSVKMIGNHEKCSQMMIDAEPKTNEMQGVMKKLGNSMNVNKGEE